VKRLSKSGLEPEAKWYVSIVALLGYEKEELYLILKLVQLLKGCLVLYQSKEQKLEKVLHLKLKEQELKELHFLDV
jgi:hypothetical protein